MRKQGWNILLLVLLILLSVRGSFANDPSKTSKEFQVKAAILYHIMHFVSWPVNPKTKPENHLVLGILGDAPFGDAFENVQGDTIYGKRLIIKSYSEPTMVDDLRTCHLLYIHPTKTQNLSAILSSIRNANVLTVSAIDGFIDKGGMIGLIRKNNKIRFEINRTIARNENIRIAAKLLRLAMRIK